jgi:hypothetical protein
MNTQRLRQVVDWQAAAWAGVASGVGHLVTTMLLSAVVLNNPWVYVRFMAALPLGESVLPPPATPTVGLVLVGLLVHMVLSIGFALLIATVIHRWGLLVGIVGGGILGIAIYVINFFALSLIFPWVYPFRSWIILAGHIAFGMLAGGVYEALEEERYVPVRGEAT